MAERRTARSTIPIDGSAPPGSAVAPVSAAPTVLDGPGGDDDFTAAVQAASSMFGDPTRRRIYLFVRDGGGIGATAGETAEEFDVHPNVARHHLDRLVAGGYLEVSAEASEGRSGRPSKRYRVSARIADQEFPVRKHELLAALLGAALSLLAPSDAEAMAERVGERYGRELGEQLRPGESQQSVQAALHAIADALTAHGFAANVERRGGALAIVNDACPFGVLSLTHPVICAVDRGIVKGMLATLRSEGPAMHPALAQSRPTGSAFCVTTV